MGKVIHHDFLFSRLKRDIRRWYEKYYFGKDIELRINIHLMILHEKYDPRNFSCDPHILEKQVADFLAMIQMNVNGYGG